MLVGFARCYPDVVPHKWDMVAILLEADRQMEGKLLGPATEAQQKVTQATEAVEVLLGLPS